jgi:ferredoxin-thioredoxin reductase catalytic chain
VRSRAEHDANTSGCYLNPDREFVENLFIGLKKNEERYGYPSCPCRRASGKLEFDRDIICPCHYRDIDVEDFGMCFCALYVRKDIFEGKTHTQPIPERRPLVKQMRPFEKHRINIEKDNSLALDESGRPQIKFKLWYCRQCGYTVFREDPPYICPVCKTRQEMFMEKSIEDLQQSSQNR